ncbi:cellulose synthase family protein [Erythrobacter rubeus]|uniref:Glycosyltransferase n=1 Tax=Erythrobacter rubeus TaxID=2760803 RepID=A0ABR8KT05_9SPHN|nr:cellulose synthase family protein [Erythrobacter rubeus]MBD2842730.1 glycosyltransferase [Erythrobacter rubeus]
MNEQAITVVQWAILFAHYSLLAGLSAYGAHRLYHLLFLGPWTREDRSWAAESSAQEEDFRPKVTVQLPIFNEKYVVERLLEKVAELDWPADRLQIQLVDDSNDETSAIASRKIRELAATGIEVEHVRRADRIGYKAGGLDHAMKTATGEFIAIFDADFLPNSDFLKQTIPCFQSEGIGMVQTRWSYLNRQRNLLTRIQALMLDAHFAVEQVIRSRSGAFFNFNGTGGVWRRTAIEDAGGWQSDTLTEDMDLSYRAQLLGWRFEYLEHIECPSELPTTMPAFKAQQHRWAKGAIEVMKKVLPSIWKSDHSLHIKVESTFHLTGNICYLLMLIDCVLFLVPSIHIRQNSEFAYWLWLDIPLFVFASLSHGLYYLYGQHRLGSGILQRMALMPAVFATSIGLCVNNSRAVIEALLGQVSAFVRTPKSGDLSEVEKARSIARLSDYPALTARGADRLEFVLSLIFFGFVLMFALRGWWLGALFLAPFCAGFFYTFLQGRMIHRAGKELATIEDEVLQTDEVIL